MNQEDYDTRYAALFRMLLGKEIRKWRICKGMTQKKLAHNASMNAQHISDIERGMHNLSTLTENKLDEVLDINLNELHKKTREEANRLIELEK